MTVHLLDEKKHLFHIRKYKDNLLNHRWGKDLLIYYATKMIDLRLSSKTLKLKQAVAISSRSVCIILK